ncbi:MAG: hypothetical protein ICV69_06430 [Thermoleophilaceae bacterium]|nr:hypothetical protein [Thermoleophilaceae bacterium]
MKRPLLMFPLLLAALAGCGSSDAGPAKDESDKRAVALECLTEDKGIDARLDGDDGIVLNADENGPRIKFFLTSGEAEGASFAGKAEGAEQIGSALLYVEPEVRQDTEELLEDVEQCLSEL